MTEQEENELICESLLGWKRGSDRGYWYNENAFCVSTPRFVNGQESEWLWAALRAAGVMMNINTATGGRWQISGFVRARDVRDCYEFCDVLEATLPLAFRAVALALIRFGKALQR